LYGDEADATLALESRDPHDEAGAAAGAAAVVRMGWKS